MDLFQSKTCMDLLWIWALENSQQYKANLLLSTHKSLPVWSSSNWTTPGFSKNRAIYSAPKGWPRSACLDHIWVTLMCLAPLTILNLRCKHSRVWLNFSKYKWPKEFKIVLLYSLSLSCACLSGEIHTFCSTELCRSSERILCWTSDLLFHLSPHLSPSLLFFIFPLNCLSYSYRFCHCFHFASILPIKGNEASDF